jgi:hypothetical protein
MCEMRPVQQADPQPATAGAAQAASQATGSGDPVDDLIARLKNAGDVPVPYSSPNEDRHHAIVKQLCRASGVPVETSSRTTVGPLQTGYEHAHVPQTRSAAAVSPSASAEDVYVAAGRQTLSELQERKHTATGAHWSPSGDAAGSGSWDSRARLVCRT